MVSRIDRFFTPRRRAGRPAATGLAVLATCLVPRAALAAEPVALRELVEVVDLSALAAAPDGRRVAVRTDRPSVEGNDYRLAWHVVDLATGARHEIAAGGEAIVNEPGLLDTRPPIWSPDGRYIYYRALAGGAVQVWRAAADGSGAEAVTAEPGDIQSLEPGPDGRSILYRVGPPRAEIEQAELAEYDAGILVDAHVELGQNVFRGAIINGRHATQRLTGSFFNRGGILWDRAPIVRRLDLLTSAVSDEGPAPPQPAMPAVSPTPPPVTLARSVRGDVATASWDGMQAGLVVARAGDGRTLSCPAPECRSERASWAAWRPGRDQLVFATSDRALVLTVRLWDLRSGRVRTIARSEGQLSGGRSENSPCTVGPAQMICVAAGPTSPPRLEAIDLESGARRLLLDPNAALRARAWPRTEPLAWTSAEGHQFTGILFVPENGEARPLPLFINYYVCRGFVRGGVGDETPFALLATRGIASVCVNATRMTGPQNGVPQYRAALGGIEALVGLLARRGLIDRDRVGLGGLSFGSEVTLWTLIHSDLIAAASIASPQFEPAAYWFNGVRGRDYHQILREVWGLGAPEETPEAWRLLSAALNAERISAPLLLQLPEQESRYAVELYARLTNSPTPAELYVFPDEPHIKFQPRHRLAVYTRNLDWFRFWLQGHEDPDPAKAAQYRRWRALAERRAEAGQESRARSQSSIETRSNNR